MAADGSRRRDLGLPGLEIVDRVAVAGREKERRRARRIVVYGYRRGAGFRGPAERADPRLPRVSRARARSVAQHARGLSLRSPPIRRLSRTRRRRSARGDADRPPGIRLRASSRRRRQNRGGTGDASAQDRLPALVLPSPPARAAARARSDRGAAAAALAREVAEGAESG